MLTLFWWLVVAHVVCDFPLQGDFLARGKNCTTPLPGVPWQICLLAHALIHGGAVALVTQNIALGLLEVFFHFVIDLHKCIGWYGFTIDQVMHVALKALYAGAAVQMVMPA